MRGVEGAGAYRIGHPLVVENDSTPFRFQNFLRNVAGGFLGAKYLIIFVNMGWNLCDVFPWRKKFLRVGTKFFCLRRARAAERDEKRPKRR